MASAGKALTHDVLTAEVLTADVLAAGTPRPVVCWKPVCDVAALAALAGIILAAVSPVDDTTGPSTTGLEPP